MFSITARNRELQRHIWGTAVFMESMSSLAVAGGFMAVLGVALAALLAFANRKLFVYEDPRIEQVEDLLPKSNCGACGMPG
ncbi:MAG: hypothetical protein ACOYBO_13235, partial [Azonexus sp.]